MSHEFTLTNWTKEPVKIVRVTNGMPCCGEVEPISATELAPGRSLEVKVTIRPSKIGPLRHWVAVTTDRSSQDDIRLVTFAQVHSPHRIEAADSKVPEVSSSQTFSPRFDWIECYSKDEPADSRLIEEPSFSVPGRASQAEWEGPPRDRPLSGALMERVRRFSVTLTAGELSGAERAELVVAYSSDRRLTHQLHWNVAGFFKFEPAALTIRTGEASGTLVLESIDGSRFDVVDIQSSIRGVTATPRGSDGIRHVIDVAIDPTAVARGTQLGQIIVTTDLAVRRTVKAPIILIGGKAKL